MPNWTKLFVAGLVITTTTGCFSPVDAFTGSYVGPLSNVGVVESSSQLSVDAPVSAPVVVELDVVQDTRFNIAASGAADAVISGLLDDVIAPTGLASPADCQLPLTYRDERLVLDAAWPCDTTDVTESLDANPSTRTTTIEVTVLDLDIAPGRGDGTMEVNGTVEIDVVTEVRDANRTRRDFGSSTLSFSHLGRHVAPE